MSHSGKIVEEKAFTLLQILLICMFVSAEFSFLFLKVKRDKDIQASLLTWNSISVSPV